MTTVLSEFSLPVGWKEIPFRGIARKVSDPGFPELEPLSVYLDAGVVPRSSRDDNHNQLGVSLDKYQRVVPNDLVFNKLRTWQGGFGISKDLGIVSPAYIVTRPDTELIDPDFLAYVLKSKPYLTELKRLSKWMPPTQFDIDWESIRSLILRVPGIEEQRNITSYLNYKISTIESLIQVLKRALVALEDFDRGTAFNMLISKVEFNAKSGFQITGKNEAWPTVPLRYICKEVKSKNRDLSESNLLSLSYGRIIPKDIDSSEGLLPESFDGYNIVEKGDTVLRLTDLQNDQKSLRVGLVEEKGIITSAYTTIRTSEIDPAFLSYQLKAFDAAKFFYALGGGLRQSMKFDDLKSIPILVPSIIEQTKFLAQLDKSYMHTNKIREALKSQIENVMLLKTSIITNCIIGDSNSNDLSEGIDV
jgi:type I restriction enzyme S subunit